jgi:alpha-N-arabinofuranosidase
MKMLGVGNEQWGGQYIERLKEFMKVLKVKHPEIKLISDPGPSPDGDMFTYLWSELRKVNAEIVDEHYYQKPEWFQNNATRYDNYDRKGPKVFAGEYAAQSVAIASPDNKNNWDCALSEAAFMTGLERNAEVVVMASYAPLFAHVEGWQWTPDLIWFDNLRSLGSANYYTQKLFSTNRGTNILPALIDDKPITGKDKLFVSSVFDKNTGEVIIKLVNTSDKAQLKDIVLEGAKKVNSDAKLAVLKSSDLAGVNTLDNPKAISPVESVIKAGKKFSINLESYSFSVIKVKVN